MFEVTKYATVNKERTEQATLNAGLAAERARVQAIGQATLEGKPQDAAMAAGKNAVAETLAKGAVTWFVVDPGVMYPAAIAYLRDNLSRLVDLCELSEGELARRAFSPNDPDAQDAKFILMSAGRKMLFEMRDAVLAVGEASWDLAMMPYDQFEDGDDDLLARDKVLEAVRRFWTEVLHQSVNNARMGIHTTKNEAWKLSPGA